MTMRIPPPFQNTMPRLGGRNRGPGTSAILARMEGEEIYRVLGTVLERATAAERRSDDKVAGLLEMFDVLVRILAGLGVLNEGHQRLLAKVRDRARAERPKVRLRLYVDKYQMPSSPVDCEKRIPICRARCCSFTVEMSKQDLDEGLL